MSADGPAKSREERGKEDETVVREESVEKTTTTTDGNATAVAVVALSGTAAIVKMGDTATTAAGTEAAVGIDIAIAAETAVTIDRGGTIETVDVEYVPHVCEGEAMTRRNLVGVVG